MADLLRPGDHGIVGGGIGPDGQPDPRVAILPPQLPPPKGIVMVPRSLDDVGRSLQLDMASLAETHAPEMDGRFGGPLSGMGAEIGGFLSLVQSHGPGGLEFDWADDVEFEVVAGTDTKDFGGKTGKKVPTTPPPSNGAGFGGFSKATGGGSKPLPGKGDRIGYKPGATARAGGGTTTAGKSKPPRGQPYMDPVVFGFRGKSGHIYGFIQEFVLWIIWWPPKGSEDPDPDTGMPNGRPAPGPNSPVPGQWKRDKGDGWYPFQGHDRESGTASMGDAPGIQLARSGTELSADQVTALIQSYLATIDLPDGIDAKDIRKIQIVKHFHTYLIDYTDGKVLGFWAWNLNLTLDLDAPPMVKAETTTPAWHTEH